MQIRHSCNRDRPGPVNLGWQRQIFASKLAQQGGVVRRAKRDVHREIGLDRLKALVRARGYHLLESGDHYIIICHNGELRVIC